MKEYVKYNKKILLIVILFFVVILSMCFLMIKEVVSRNINEKIKKNETIRDISFEPYSNSNNLIILVTIEDTEYGINTISYRNKNNKEINISCNGKKKIVFDYEIANDGEYNFIAYNCNGEKIEKGLVIDSSNLQNDTFGELIDIQIEPIIDEGRTMAVKADVTIDYKYGFGTNYYKIGNSNSWIKYNEKFQIDSYTILNSALQESDNQTIIVYAKKEDNISNKIVISKQTTQLDLDMPQIPNIIQTSAPAYPLLTANGAVFDSKISIDYGTRTDINKLYSIDNGLTWQEYIGEFESNAIYVMAKSENKNSGLYSSSKKIMEATASDAFPLTVFDDSTSTYFNGRNNVSVCLDNSTWGKKLNVVMSTGAGDGWLTSWSFVDSNNNVLLTWKNGPWYNKYNKVFTIPENSYKFTRGSVRDCTVYYLKITD